ncbi:hypothetical protein LCGC14_2684850 [marine sediment metagenome]|uniref:Uncharacterized protein n=1 Tax=marine sediment metagenome TaxID=412755 RepID=A0A0F9CBZ8_9ZZZZ
MIKVYILPVTRQGNRDTVARAEYIHDAVLRYDVGTATLIQDTSPEEDSALAAIALQVRGPSPSELEAFLARPMPPPPTADELRARELLANSPDVITLPEIWETLRIFGRRLGY